MRQAKFVLAAILAGALYTTGAAARAGLERGTAGGIARLGGFHRFPSPVNHLRFPSPANHLRFSPRIGRFGEFHRLPVTSTTVADDDYVDDYDTGPENGDLAGMHFRVQDSFGPWDIPIRPLVREPPPPEPGYGPDDVGPEPPPTD
ncbi:MAG TPA: hypothetical protein VGL35_05480 [Rhizomicrobium sp.]|jgi:hypothetical protein